MRKTGLYFLANNRVIDLCVAFLNSFRERNRSIPICLIPYDEHCDDVIQMRERFDFSVFEDKKILLACDRIGQQLHGKNVGEYRKLAAWHGTFEQFIYIDVDTVVCRNIDDLFHLLSECVFLSSHSNHPSTRKYTWKDSAIGSCDLSVDQIDYAANTGFIGSTRGALKIDMLGSTISGALKCREHMELRSAEQPFLNYAFVTSGLSYTSLSALREQHGQVHLPHECWAGDSRWDIKPRCEARYDGEMKDVLMVHWAGIWADNEPRLGGDKESRDHCSRLRNIRRDLPKEELWTYYYTLIRSVDGVNTGNTVSMER
jgi:hypothetical protein